MVQVGDRIRGFAEGHFGRDSHDDKVVEAVGRDWVVARDERGEIWFASGADIHEKLRRHIPRPGTFNPA